MLDTSAQSLFHLYHPYLGINDAIESRGGDQNCKRMKTESACLFLNFIYYLYVWHGSEICWGMATQDRKSVECPRARFLRNSVPPDSGA